MPINLDPNNSGISYSGADIEYTYPNSLDLRPTSHTHQVLLTKLLLLAQESSREMSKRHSSWKKIDRTLTAYIPLDEKETLVQENDERKPVSIVIPYSFATLETLLTYFSAAFLDYPIFKYEGTSPEDRVGAMLMEKVIEQQSRRSKMALALLTTFRDSWAYGFGSAAPYWDKVYGKKTTVVDAGFFSAIFGKMLSSGKKRQSVDTILYEGNFLRNIDPYMTLPDPNVPIHEVQKGEYFGWIDPSNYKEILNNERNDKSYFNARYLSEMRGSAGRSQYNKAKANSGRDERFGTGLGELGVSTSPIDRIFMYVNIIPKEWQLGTSEYPEKWLFCIAADKVILCAKPLGLDHNMFPVATASPDYDGYSVTPISRLELISGLQTTLDWLVNCYDDQTEVLTDQGWVFLSKTKGDEKVATVDPDTREFWFEEPKQWFEYPYDGYLLNFKSSRMDICVTPNHNMFARKRYQGAWEFIPAITLATQAKDEYKTIGNLNWEGKEPIPVSFSGEKPIRDRGHKPKYSDVEIDPMVLAGFLGWFLSEGSITHGSASGSYSIAIKQSKKAHIKEIDSLMKSMPFHVTVSYDTDKYATQWTITDKRLYTWLKDNCYIGGTTGEFKKVPDFVRNWDHFHLNLLFERAMWGDGSWMPGHENLGRYGSKSKMLVDGLQEVAIRLGYFTHTKESATPNGLPFFLLNISTNETNPTISTRNCYKVKYSGRVYCFENSTHLTITRRNGKVSIQGQSHIANVRKSINDMLVVDPSLVNINDLLDPAPGKLIRMRRAAWGRGVENAVKQLAVTDITRSHIQDSAYITELIKTCSGSVDSVMGLARSGSERVSADESRGTRMAALSRLAKAARVVSLQMMTDLSYMLASHTQQLMSKELYVSVTGRWEEELMAQYPNSQGRIKVSPFDISIDYDIQEGDGTLPTGENADVMVQLFQSISSQPILQQQFDLVRIFQRIAMMMGIKDVNEFKIRGQQMPQMNATALPDQTVLNEAQKGNLVPLA